MKLQSHCQSSFSLLHSFQQYVEGELLLLSSWQLLRQGTWFCWFCRYAEVLAFEMKKCYL